MWASRDHRSASPGMPLEVMRVDAATLAVIQAIKHRLNAGLSKSPHANAEEESNCSVDKNLS